MWDNIWTQAFYIATVLAYIEGSPYSTANFIIDDVFDITLFP